MCQDSIFLLRPGGLGFLATLGLDGANAEMFAECGRMDADARRKAVNTALDFLVAGLTGALGPI